MVRHARTYRLLNLTHSLQGPPFFAYYGALTNNQSLLQLAYDQCSLYRSALSQPSGLWTHISGGSGTSDSGEWATGNAWAAAGMVRVLATIKQSSFAGSMESQMGDLQNWAGDILGAAQNYIVSPHPTRIAEIADLFRRATGC